MPTRNMCSVETYQQSGPLAGTVLDGRYRVEVMIATGGRALCTAGWIFGWTGPWR